MAVHLFSVCLMPSLLSPFSTSSPLFQSMTSHLYSHKIFSSDTYSCNRRCKDQQANLILRATVTFTITNIPGRKPAKEAVDTVKRNSVFSSRVERDSPRSVVEAINLFEKNGALLMGEEEEEETLESLDCDKKERMFEVRGFVKRILALRPSQRITILGIFTKIGAFSTICNFNNMLMSFVVADETDLALKLFSGITSNGLAPNARTFSILMWCHCKKNDTAEAKGVLDDMIEKGFKPNVITFTKLINSFCRKGKLKRAFEVLEIMRQIGCKPSIQTYNCLMKGLCYLGRVEEAFEVLMSVKESTRETPDIYSYAAVMDGLCKVGRSDEAMELLEDAVKMGITPNAVVFNMLFNGYCREGRPLEGIELIKQMKELNCMPDKISYSTLLHGLLRWGKNKAALDIYKEMMEYGFKVDERMMDTLLRGICRDSLRDERMLFEEMRNGVSAIYHETYELVIQALCTGSENDKASINLKRMVGSGRSPSMATFNSVIRVLCFKGMVEEALLILVLIDEATRIPSKVAYNLLINEFNLKGMSLTGSCVYGAALKHGVVPDKKPKEKFKQ